MPLSMYDIRCGHWALGTGQWALGTENFLCYVVMICRYKEIR